MVGGKAMALLQGLRVCVLAVVYIPPNNNTQQHT